MDNLGFVGTIACGKSTADDRWAGNRHRWASRPSYRCPQRQRGCGNGVSELRSLTSYERAWLKETLDGCAADPQHTEDG